MVLNTLESLVIRALPVVVRDVVVGLTTAGSRQAGAQVPTVNPSFARHLSPDYPGADPSPLMRHELAKNREARAARRAGRPGSPAGVPFRRTATRTGRSAILSGWSQAAGSIGRVGSKWCSLAEVTPTLAAGRMLPGRTQARMHLTADHVAGKCSRDGLGVKTPARGTPSASI
jgi:hypothetical protein